MISVNIRGKAYQAKPYTDRDIVRLTQICEGLSKGDVGLDKERIAATTFKEIFPECPLVTDNRILLNVLELVDVIKALAEPISREYAKLDTSSLQPPFQVPVTTIPNNTSFNFSMFE